MNMDAQMKKICFLCLTILTMCFSELNSKHIIKIQNKTGSPAIVIIMRQESYYNRFQSYILKIDTNLTYSFSNTIGKYNLKIYKNDDFSDMEDITYYDFLDDTLKIEIEKDTVIAKSINGYDNELNFKGDSLSLKMSEYINIKKWDDYVSYGKKCFIEGLKKINNENFKSEEVKSLLKEKLRISFQDGILNYILTNKYNFKTLTDFNTMAEYDSLADYDVINNPKYPNTMSYNFLINNLYQVRKNIINESIFNKLRLSKQQEILNHGLSGFGLRAMNVLEFKNLFEGINSPFIIKRIFKKMNETTEMDAGEKQDKLAILENKLKFIKGEKFPLEEFIEKSGNKIKISDYKGKVLLLVFWASWCSGCIENFPLYKALMSELKDDNIELLLLSIDDDLKAYQKIVNDYPLNNAKYINIGYNFLNADLLSLNISAVPHFIVLDKEGRIYDYEYSPSSHKSAVKELKKLSKQIEE